MFRRIILNLLPVLSVVLSSCNLGTNVAETESPLISQQIKTLIMEKDAGEIETFLKDHPEYAGWKDKEMPFFNMLEFACAYKRPEVVELLLNYPVEVDASGLCYALWSVKAEHMPSNHEKLRIQCLEKILSRKPDLGNAPFDLDIEKTVQSSFFEEAMMSAIDFGDDASLEYLIQQGADPKLHSCMGKGWTMLDCAIGCGAKKCEKILRAHGATAHPNVDSSVTY